jgi:hypothetical protein
MWAGEEHYTVSSFIEEARTMGVSKRIPATAVPEGIVPGRSRILIKHRRAIVHSNSEEYTLHDLVEHISILRDGPMYDVRDDMLQIVMMLERFEEVDHDFWMQLVSEYDLYWTPGVIGYSYITSIQYVAHDHEEGLPEEMAHLEGYVEPVRIEYEDS